MTTSEAREKILNVLSKKLDGLFESDSPEEILKLYDHVTDEIINLFKVRSMDGGRHDFELMDNE